MSREEQRETRKLVKAQAAVEMSEHEIQQLHPLTAESSSTLKRMHRDHLAQLDKHKERVRSAQCGVVAARHVASGIVAALVPHAQLEPLSKKDCSATYVQYNPPGSSW